MAELPPDQAAGLRRLFRPEQVRSISICGGRGNTGTTSVVINLGHALCKAGRRVLILDEFSSNGNVVARLGGNTALDLQNILRRKLPLEDILVDGPDGLLVMPIAADTGTLAGLSFEEQQQLSAAFGQIARLADLILLDARNPSGPEMPSVSLAASDCLIVVNGRAESITDAYANIKLLASNFGRREFWVLVNRVDTLEQARAIFDRIRDVARRFMSVRLRLMGYVPQDEKLHQANRQLKPIASAFPAAEANLAFQQLADSVLRWPAPNQPDYDPAGFVHCLIESSRVMMADVRSN